MRRSSIHLLIIVSLIAALGTLRRPESPDPIPVEKTEAPERTPTVYHPKPKDHQLFVGNGKVTKQAVAPTPQRKVEPRKENPQPSGVYEGLRTNQGLSVRGISLGMTQSETEALYPGPEVVDRIEEYWGPGYRNEFRRFGATWYKYSGFYASFDRERVCGAVVGDGLERRGVPILARGDTGADVERLLGRPSGYGRPKSYGRDSGADYCAWSFWFTDDSYLTIRFTDGLVQSFEWRDAGFSDSGC